MTDADNQTTEPDVFDRLFRDDPHQGLTVIRLTEMPDVTVTLCGMKAIGKSDRPQQTKADWKRAMKGGR